MHLTLGQIVDQPGIHRSKKKLSLFGSFSCTRYIVQDPGNLRAAEISIRYKTCAFPDHLSIACRHQFIDLWCCPPALPDNSIVNRLSRLLIPDDRRFSLVGDTNSADILPICPCHRHGFCQDSELRRPDFYRIMLYPAGLWINLGKLLLRHAADVSPLVEQDTS